MQTLFTNNDAEARRSPIPWQWRVVGAAMFGLSFVIRHDVPLGLLFVMVGIFELVRGLKPLQARLLLPAVAALFASVGIIEIRSGRGIGWVCCAWATIIAASFFFAERPLHSHEG